MDILQTFDETQWLQTLTAKDQLKATSALENGKVIFYPKLAFELLPHENVFLSDKFSDGKAKNISYDIKNNRVRGANCSSIDEKAISKMMLRFNQQATLLVSQLFPNYIPYLQVARTSYRPVEIAGRETSYKKDDTRLHVDAFSSSPNQGKRILRVFSNINPNGQARVWRLGEPFTQVAERFLPRIKNPMINPWILQAFKVTKSLRTHYDHIMLQLHDRMKKDLDYQKNAEQIQCSFPPNCTWVVQTDHVSHAAISGQFVLEQTFYLPVEGMVNPELSPLRILEKMTQKKLV